MVFTLACSPTNQNTEDSENDDSRDYMMDDDMMEDEEKEAEDDSVKNRDMLSQILVLD
ncbi:hypothetical protein WJR50_16230 [Catalinimonas sp. 4WD22]